MSVIEWQSNLGYAEDSARSERKPILLDLCNPAAIGCQQMDAAIYFRGINLYKMKCHSSELKKAYEQLTTLYPASNWAKRAAPCRLL